MRQWLLGMLKKTPKSGTKRPGAAHRRRACLSLEALEQREVMTASTVGALQQLAPPPFSPAQVRTVAAAPAVNSPLQAAPAGGVQNLFIIQNGPQSLAQQQQTDPTKIIPLGATPTPANSPLQAAPLSQAIAAPSAPAQARSLNATAAVQNQTTPNAQQASAPVRSLDASSPIQPQDRLASDLKGFHVLLNEDSGNGPAQIEMQIQSIQSTGVEGQDTISGIVVDPQGEVTRFTGTATDHPEDGTAFLEVSGLTPGGRGLAFSGKVNVINYATSGQFTLQANGSIPWSGSYSGMGEADSSFANMAARTQSDPASLVTRQDAGGALAAAPRMEMQSLGQTQQTAQEQSSASMVRPLASSQLAQVQSPAQASPRAVTSAVAPQEDSGGGLDLSFPGLADAVNHTLQTINNYRASVGVPPVKLDLGLGIFAQLGSMELRADHIPHQHALDVSWADKSTIFGFRQFWSENQSNQFGEPPAGSVNEQIDNVLAKMFDEGPDNGDHQQHGHFINMTNPDATRVGVGLVADAQGNLYLTTDFSA